jgi:UDP-2,3-diacylglucosamine pyrophosphatase LpxH
MSTVVLSDTHIGTNYRTCWYQRSVHEPYLTAVLQHIIDSAGRGSDPVARLILLGDFFDFWTYPPGMQPPDLDAIIEANPRVLGPDGMLRKVLDALDGEVVFVRGNHDITITQEDLRHLPIGEHEIELVEDVLADDSGMLYTHGHVYTMFNAPDARYPGEVPVGHFVTRAICHYLDRVLPPGRTAAHLANQGSPYGFQLSSLLPQLATQLTNPSITDALLGYIAARCGMSESQAIILPDGSTSSISQAKDKYDGLWTEWAEANGGGAIGALVAAKSAQADYDGTYLPWFALRDVMTRGAAGVVTGHTHVPRSGIEGSPCLYANGGFECPSLPDIAVGTARFNVTLVEDGPAVRLLQVTRGDQGYRVGPASALPDRVVPRSFEDFSCYVRIVNNSTHALVTVIEEVEQGFKVVPPPARIPAGKTAQFWLQDLPGPLGSAGSAKYRRADGTKQFHLTYACPTAFASNRASGGGSLRAAVQRSPEGGDPYETIPSTGHPLFVDFYVEPVDDDSGDDEAHPAAWEPTSPLARAVDAAGFRYDPRQDIIYSRMDALQRQFGYAYGYDAAALGMNAVIDCEPLFFEYDDKYWMVELWKGQYGLETGCEIGVYNRSKYLSSPLYDILDATVGQRPHDPVPWHSLFFDCASDRDRLLMTSTLFRRGEELFSRGPERHWWLTGFEWGVLSSPSDLRMDVSIQCQSAPMRNALVDQLETLDYEGVHVVGNTVAFTFENPRTFQPRSETPELVDLANLGNAALVAAYNGLGLENNDPNAVGSGADRLIASSVAVYTPQFFAAADAGLLSALRDAVPPEAMESLRERLTV